jgi:hypothetical protein
MDRRQVLASASAALGAALAGCMGGGDDDTSTTTTTEQTKTTTTTTTTTTTEQGPMAVGEELSLGDDQAMAVSGLDASAFVVSRDGSERVIHSGNATRYVHVTFEVDNVDDYESFVRENAALRLNEETYTEPVFPLGGGFNQFTAAYPVPNDVTAFTGGVELDASDATGTWEFDARNIEAVTMTVDWEVTNVAAPDSVAPEADFTVDLTVVNDGDDIEFVTKYAVAGGSPSRDRWAAAGGEESTITLELTAPAADGASEFDVSMDWGARSVTRTIAFAEESEGE